MYGTGIVWDDAWYIVHSGTHAVLRRTLDSHRNHLAVYVMRAVLSQLLGP